MLLLLLLWIDKIGFQYIYIDIQGQLQLCNIERFIGWWRWLVIWWTGAQQVSNFHLIDCKWSEMSWQKLMPINEFLPKIPSKINVGLWQQTQRHEIHKIPVFETKKTKVKEFYWNKSFNKYSKEARKLVC